MAQLKSYQQISPDVCPAAVFSRLVTANRTNVSHLTISAFINMFTGNLLSRNLLWMKNASMWWAKEKDVQKN